VRVEITKIKSQVVRGVLRSIVIDQYRQRDIETGGAEELEDRVHLSRSAGLHDRYTEAV
jgi:hypothetical protein